MARTIESPGVEIKEIDLSLNASLPVGTKVLVNGFASQGPTNELLYVSNTDEMNQIFFGGAGPTNDAERYFYHTCNEIFNSPATLLVTRLPYGSGGGTGYDGEYSVLAYPANGYILSSNVVEFSGVSAGLSINSLSTVINGSFNMNVILSTVELAVDFYKLSTVYVSSIALSTLVASSIYISDVAVLSSDDNGILCNSDYLVGSINSKYGTWSISGLSGSTFDGNSTITATYITNSAFNVNEQYDLANILNISAPYVVPVSEAQYENIKSGQITWNGDISSQTQVPSSFLTLGNAAMIVVNEAKTTINEKYEGYYVVVCDNTTAGNNAISGFDSISKIRTLNSSSNFKNLPDSVLGFELTGSATANNDNISEIVETAFNYDFSNSYYDDTLVMYIFRLRTNEAANDPTKLFYIPVEKFVGSLESIDKRTNGTTSQLDTFFLQNLVNEKSNYIKMFVNTKIAEQANITEINNTSKVLNPIGTYTPCKSTDDSLKYIGDVAKKLTMGLTLAENVLNLDVDIVLDAGLSTIFTYTQDLVQPKGDATYSEAKNVYDGMEALVNSTTGMESNYAQYHKTIFDIFNNFCQNTRKDCIHISDPLRGIFVQGADTKVMSLKSKNFSQHIYTPMKNIYAGYNSNYACTYANWIRKYDSVSGKFVWLPFSGFQAAIMARMDSNLYPWYAPFGLNNGVIRNITDIACRPNQKQNDMLYRIGVNPVVFFQGDGFVVWGQKTLQAKPSAFDRINVRRLFLVLERATMKVLRYFVGQPNTVFTRTRVNNVLKPVFDLAKNNEGVYDYKVICSEDNNPPAVIDNNEMHVSIYLKPVRTAEFIIVTFVATRTDQNFSELTI